ncbi:AraC family transcriptional regulator [Nocardia tengchongensis]|uniref:AraC family transcriptional regulator n=1 Tax=Nocardia tengchongensis TaxID=2055889 RepID=UPI0036B9A2F9
MLDFATVDVGAPDNDHPGEPIEQWQGVITDRFVPFHMAALTAEAFHGRATDMQFRDFGLSSIHAAGAHEVHRTSRHIAAGDDSRYLVVIMLASGSLWVEQGGNCGLLQRGSIAVCDTGYAFAARSTDNVTGVLIRVPVDRVRERTGLTANAVPLAMPIPVEGPLKVVSNFFVELATLPPTAPNLGTVAAHGPDLLASLILLIAGHGNADEPSDLSARNAVLAFVQANYGNPDLSANDVALACGLSRRTLYRVCEPFGGVAALIRRTRIDQARKLLRDGALSTTAVIRRCGFSTERSFYRTFRQVTGTTPGEIRTVRTFRD